jgi:hypothetical protein
MGTEHNPNALSYAPTCYARNTIHLALLFGLAHTHPSSIRKHPYPVRTTCAIYEAMLIEALHQVSETIRDTYHCSAVLSSTLGLQAPRIIFAIQYMHHQRPSNASHVQSGQQRSRKHSPNGIHPFAARQEQAAVQGMHHQQSKQGTAHCSLWRQPRGPETPLHKRCSHPSKTCPQASAVRQRLATGSLHIVLCLCDDVRHGKHPKQADCCRRVKRSRRRCANP